ncbi:hypothetical protein [Amycolatopsis sp. WAC 04182]|uniref:hypothetical protein n=1 Tax=Amycolatopsis sp. WAC 04182 TaxID=2203198 RepID=UPI001F25DEA4|nr:hypothetical protein [Amycolatopsis sp. WAC 04182]
MSEVAAARHSRGGRISSLDLLRGVAILGAFGTNVFLFAHPGGPAGSASASALPLNVLTGFSGPDWLLVDRFLAPRSSRWACSPWSPTSPSGCGTGPEWSEVD